MQPRLAVRTRLTVELLEDRLVPGEALSSLLLGSLGISPFGDLLARQFHWSEGPAFKQDVAVSATPVSKVQEVTPVELAPEAILLAWQSEMEPPAVVGTAHPDGPEGPMSCTSSSFGDDAPAFAFDFAPAVPATPQVSGMPFTPDHSEEPTGGGTPLNSATITTTQGAGESRTGCGAAMPQSLDAPAPATAGGEAKPMLDMLPSKQNGKPASAAPAGFSPAQIRHAYGFDRVPQDGAGVTIAIIDAYDAPNIQADLDTFSGQYGLPKTTDRMADGVTPYFTLAKAFAQGSQPATDGAWAQEISLDVEWAHAIAPRANILLVEAASNSFVDLCGGVDYAVNHGASIVSMSWGASEDYLSQSFESACDLHFNVPGVAFLAATGDGGGQVSYPAASPYVIAVGGTTLPLDANGNLRGNKQETAWNSGGGGASAFETRPGYQNGVWNGPTRGTPDVSYNADPATGVAVYDSTPYQGRSGWLVIGGTSAGTPQWAALAALVDQVRAAPLASANLTSSWVYGAAAGSLYGSNYRDITSGSDGFAAAPGYDLATGLGSPLANKLVPWLQTH